MNNINSRKGKIILNRDLVLKSDEKILKALFSNFYPMACEPNHDMNFWGSILYWGISPHFDIVEEACVTPEYEAIITTKHNDDGKLIKATVEFKKL